MDKVFSSARLSRSRNCSENSLHTTKQFISNFRDLALWARLSISHSSLFPRPGLASFVFLIFVLFSSYAHSADVTLAWDANPAADQITSFAIYYKSGSPGPPYDGIGAFEGDSPIIATVEEFNDPENPDYTISNLDAVETYFFVVTATNEYGESGFSNEISVTHSNKSLVFTPVSPCRIIDTRLAGGAFLPGGIRSYNVWGAVSAQGGNPAGCPSPSGEPRAVIGDR